MGNFVGALDITKAGSRLGFALGAEDGTKVWLSVGEQVGLVVGFLSKKIKMRVSFCNHA